MSCNGRPFGDLESYALDWLKLPPRRLELCAALKDFQGLYDLAPTSPANIANIGGGVIPRLCPFAELVSDMKGTLKDILKHTRRNLKVVMPVISPYLGDPHKVHCKSPQFNITIAPVCILFHNSSHVVRGKMIWDRGFKWHWREMLP